MKDEALDPSYAGNRFGLGGRFSLYDSMYCA